MTPTVIFDTALMDLRPEVIARYQAGDLVRWGGVLRVKKGLPKAGSVVAHLRDVVRESGQDALSGRGTSNVAASLKGMAGATGGASVPSAAFQSLVGLTNVAAAASVVNLGVSVAGFALVLHKLGKIQDQIASLESLLTGRFDAVDGKLEMIAAQLVELRFVQACHGDMLERSLRHLQRLHTDRSLEHIAAVRAELELLARDGTPSATRVESADRTFKAARHFLSLSISTHTVSVRNETT